MSASSDRWRRQAKVTRITLYGLATIVSRATMVLLFATAALAEERQYIRKNETFCDSSGVLCLYGSLTYGPNSRIVSLNARVQKPTGPGTLIIILTGSNRQEMLRRTEIRLTIRGTYSEIINHQMRPDAPDVSEWEISSFVFNP